MGNVRHDCYCNRSIVFGLHFIRSGSQKQGNRQIRQEELSDDPSVKLRKSINGLITTLTGPLLCDQLCHHGLVHPGYIILCHQKNVIKACFELKD